MPSNVIMPADSACNLGVIFDSTLSMSNHISALFKSCFQSIRDLRRIRNTLDHSTSQTVAVSLIHSKLDYRNSVFLYLPRSQLDRLQLILQLKPCLKLLNSVTFHMFLNLFIGLKLNSASMQYNFSPPLTKHFNLTNQHISRIYSMFNATVSLALRLLTSSLCGVLHFPLISN